MSREVRVLFLADSHLGFDLPVRPRVERRRRGHDFLANYAAALEPALSGDVDLVVHGGDVFHRPAVISTVAYQAFEPLTRIADCGVPVYLVPGNHERSRLPHLRLASHPRIHVFDRPRNYLAEVRGTRIALAGFPYERREVRSRFPALVEATGWSRDPADVRLLCVHHCVEGATVGPGNFTFTTAADVVRPRDLPRGFAAVLSGHIHRHQVLTRDRSARPLPAPVLYPGSIERTSLAEIDEPKGYLVLRLWPGGAGPDLQWEFRPLPARPMIRRQIAVAGMAAAALEQAVRDIIAAVPPDAVLSIRAVGALEASHWRVLAAGHLRTFVPATMNLEIRPDGRFDPKERGAATNRREHRASTPSAELMPLEFPPG